MLPVCDTPNCGKEAKFRCPTCSKLGIEGSFFCTQNCFKGYWKEHKKVHALFEQLKNQGAAPLGGDLSQPLIVSWPGYNFTGDLRPYRQSPRRQLPDTVTGRPDYWRDGTPYSERQDKGLLRVLGDEEQEDMRIVCRLAREVLEEAMRAVEPGVTTDAIDRLVHEASIERDCYPSPLNYYGFPKSCCTSVNEVICHGIPDMRPLADGDIVNIDVTCYHREHHGDLNETAFVGSVDEESRRLVQVTWECLRKAIEMVKPGVRYRDVGDVIQQHAHSAGLSVVRTYCGHGVHRLFHCAPNVPHYARNKAVGVMKPGHVFTIEPMINQGVWKDQLWPDKWTSVTLDGKRPAQFEDTLLVTETGCEVLTRRSVDDGKPFFMSQPA
uniref:Methionine aminopeptidase n=1 Tax=Macrostomum lignano TaxID=282301 RepID=A0A1I8HCZ4_9PLAT